MKTVFLRLLESADKPVGILRAVARRTLRGDPPRYELNVGGFSAIPKSPFAYWVTETISWLFVAHTSLGGAARTACQGLATADDFRFVRLWLERHGTAHAFAKGGAFSRYYFDHSLILRWREDGRELKSFAETLPGTTHWSRRIANAGHYFRPGLTWPRRTQSGLSLRVMPSGCIFADKGPAAFVEGDDPANLLALVAITNSGPFTALVELQMAFGSYEVGVIQRTPVPDLDPMDREALAELAARAWSLKRGLDTRAETSHAFERPALLQAAQLEQDLAQRRKDAKNERTNEPLGVFAPLREILLNQRARDLAQSREDAKSEKTIEPLSGFAPLREIPLSERAQRWQQHMATVEAELDTIQAEIDDRCYALYGISDEDRASIERGFGAPAADALPSDDDEDADADADADDTDAEVDAGPMVASLLSWSLGVGFGRFDVRLATGERELPPEPEPFDPLPPCSPGMLTRDDGLPLDELPPGYPIAFPTDGVLVDDPGHPRDLLAAARHVFDVVFPADSDARWHEAAELVAARKNDLRDWFSRTFFEQHLKRYSKSRRKAPIYWQLATPSASYSVWLYCHRLTRDSFFKVLNDYVTPKLQHEESKLTALVQAGGPNPSTSQGKAIAAQESFVEELRAFREEVERVAPLFHPDLDDGIVLVKAPLWRLVPQHKAWQKELRSKWEELQAGKYDWAHLAMHLWPERVVPKCAEDRSLAIAHDLEEAFWYEDDAGKWQKRDVPPETVAALVRERTSPSVKDALQRLLEAPAPKGTVRRKKRQR